MSEQLLSIDPAEFLQAFGIDRATPMDGARGSDPGLQGRWLNTSGEPLGPALPLGAMASIRVEGFDGTGAIFSRADPQPLALPVDVPTAAAALEIIAGEAVVYRRNLDQLARRGARLGQPVRDRIGPAESPLRVQVVAERFADFNRFRALTLEAWEWARTCRPFNEEGIRDRLAYDLLFWPSDSVSGLFDTPDSRSNQGRLFYGNRELARRLLDPYLHPRVPSIILIDSRARGGAGGAGAYSAWTSVGSDDWKGVFLHELGHSFGLADEYLDSQREHEPLAGEPNVSDQRRAGLAPWSGIITVSPDASPSHGLDHQGDDTAGEIGTFAGARYRTDLFRSMRDCLMRSTATHHFCEVCAAVIRRSLDT